MTNATKDMELKFYYFALYLVSNCLLLRLPGRRTILEFFNY